MSRIFLSMFLFAILASMFTASIFSVQFIKSAEAHAEGVVLSASTLNPPTMDGVIGSAEWSDASSYDFVTVVGSHFTGTMYTMNDEENLYLAIKIRDTSLSDRILQIDFDNNHNGTIEAGEDFIGSGDLASLLSDQFVEDIGSDFESFGVDQDAGGTYDLTWGATTDGTFSYIEISHPLCSSDPHDFCLSAQDKLGFNFLYSNGSKAGNFPSDPKLPFDASGFGDIVIATTASLPELIDILEQTVKSLDIPSGMKTALLGPLHNIEKILTDDDSANDQSACAKLDSFISSLNDKAGKHGLTTSDADELTGQAEAIKEAIGC